jgi:uncharacterized protein
MVLIVVVVLLVSAGAYALLPSPGKAEPRSTPSAFTVNGRTFAFTYIATNSSQREAGLMNKKITNSTTMLFVFPDFGIHSFWMYDTNSSLDMVWVNASGRSGIVVYVVSGAPSCFLPVGCPVYTPTTAANYVIEAAAGFAAANNVKVGTTVQFS